MPTAETARTNSDAGVDVRGDHAGRQRDDRERDEVGHQRHGGRELEDPPVRGGRGDVLLLDELHPVGDELGPAVEAAGVHRPEPALHVGHHLVLGLPDEQRQDEEGGQHAERAQDHLEGRAHRSPARVLIAAPTTGRARRAARSCAGSARRCGRGARGRRRSPPAPWPRATALLARAARTNDLRSGVPSKPVRQQQRPHPEAGAVVEPGEVDPEHLVRLALVPGRAGPQGGDGSAPARPRATRVRTSSRRSEPAPDGAVDQVADDVEARAPRRRRSGRRR